MKTGLDFTLRYQQLVEMLMPFAAAWNQSVLHHWPACRDALPVDWWESLLDWPLEELHALDDVIAGAQSLETLRPVPKGLRDFLVRTQPLLSFPPGAEQQALPELKTLRMTAKKQHEIGVILPFLARKKSELDWQRSVDIGGGVGHLARTLATELGLSMISIDRDASLHSMGRALLEKLKVGGASLEFVCGEMKAESQHELDTYFREACLSIGLHTCGPLAWTHLKKSQQSRSVLNFGCCYDRMEVTRDCQQSQVARAHPLPLTSFALFLATRGRRRTLDELRMQERVNTYRLALHLFLIEEGLAAGFLAVGDAPRALYQQGFVAYAADRFRFLQKDFAPYQSRAAGFIQSERVQRSMREFFLINIVRNAFARPLEVLLLLDRALWMEEQGHEVEMRQFFDHSISPRNLGIFALIKKP